jgi:hypothetical protein
MMLTFGSWQARGMMLSSMTVLQLIENFHTIFIGPIVYDVLEDEDRSIPDGLRCEEIGCWYNTAISIREKILVVR